ncbi:MAG: radical SAM protein [Nitrospirae bacterium]|nr:radical SAM protein [Nitrospirota bacterium]
MKESRIRHLQNKYPDVPLPVLIKAELLFNGVRYTPELGEAGAWAIPNWHPYRFQEGEENPTGKDSVNIPYLIILEGGGLVRILGNGNSPYNIVRDIDGYALMEQDEKITTIDFQKKPLWHKKNTSDGTPMVQAGATQHCDMLILNPTPGCEYFLYTNEQTGENYRCKFCHYGVPDKRTKILGQKSGIGDISSEHLNRLMEVCAEASPAIKHFYLVGGSMTDIDEEGRRYLQLAEALQKVNKSNIPVCCGSSSLKRDALLRLRDAGVTGACFNLEVWDEDIWKRACPGKAHFTGREQWLKGLTDAVEIFGRGNVMSAFVAGIEFNIEKGFGNTDEALQSCVNGAEWLLRHGILPLYSIQWPFTSASAKKFPLDSVLDYFIRLNASQAGLRKKYGLAFPNDFVCHRCTYMQLECDFDFYLK